jgi:hypothetical protein
MGKKIRALERKISGVWGDGKVKEVEEWRGMLRGLDIRLVGEGYWLLRRHRLSILKLTISIKYKVSKINLLVFKHSHNRRLACQVGPVFVCSGGRKNSQNSRGVEGSRYTVEYTPCRETQIVPCQRGWRKVFSS